MASATAQHPASSDSLSVEDVIFTTATPHQRILAWTLNGTAWAGAMTLDQYIRRETILSEAPLSANGGTTYLILHPRGDPETIVSSCEVTRKRALVLVGEDGDRQQQQQQQQQPPREVTAYGVASVFTNPRFRGRGMAAHMLRKVQELVDRELNAEFGVLYSDIGRRYYSRLGWKDFGTPQLRLTLSEPARDAGGSGDGSVSSPALATAAAKGSIALLREDEALALAEEDVERVRRALAESARLGAGDGRTRVAFLPDAELLRWHFARDGYACRTLAGREAAHRGARTADASAWVLWDHDLREGKLKVLRLVEDAAGSGGEGERREHVKALLRAALAEAADWGLRTVLVWSPSKAAAAAAAELWSELQPRVQVALEEREDGSVPSLRWKGDKPLDNVVWEANEYFAWC
ncbi:hypothetical protein VTJ83DRAFT_133 [Remersonia thermophila]|uniref:LYC1 C-terminal domain-containing protein n=1 Tax=Remersonia thermophila TaxID=72144 RepID=A0ABR4DKE9_9PEZI